MATTTITSQDYSIALADLGYTLRYNEITKHIEVNGNEYTDYLEADIRRKMYDLGYKRKQILDDVIITDAHADTYNPIKERLESLPAWDNVPRLMDVAGCLNAEDPVLTEALLQKWLIGAVSKLYAPTQNMMMVIQGPQGSGKSTFASWLASPFDPIYYTEGPINPDNKDHQIKACTHYLWEVGELGSTTRRADYEALKEFLTSRNFTIRMPYAHNAETCKSICSYIGTVNEAGGFLSDPSGNRRFWIIKSAGIDYSYANYNPADLWAEAYYKFRSGISFTLTADEMRANASAQQSVEVVDLTAETMRDLFDIDPSHTDWEMPISQVRDYLAQHSTLGAQDLTAVKLGASAVRLGLGKAQRWMDGQNKKVYIGLRLRV